MNESLRHLIKKVAKHSNANYKAVVQGKRKKYQSDEMIYQRILNKTQDQEYAERWLQMKKSPLWRDIVKAEQIAIHLQCLKY